MHVVRVGGEEIDRCARCQVEWLDAGELDGILRTVARESLARLGPTKKPGRRADVCPVCRAWMRPAGLHGAPTETFSACGHGQWLRQGQLRRIVTVGHWEHRHTKRCNGGGYARRMESFTRWLRDGEARRSLNRVFLLVTAVSWLGDAPAWQIALWLALPAAGAVWSAVRRWR